MKTIDEKLKKQIAEQFRKLQETVKNTQATNLTELFKELDSNGLSVYFGLDNDFFYAEYENIIADVHINKNGEKAVHNDVQVFDDDGNRLELHYFIN